MVRVNIEVADETRNEWKEYADAETNGNLSTLIRQSVSKEIKGTNNPGNNEEVLQRLGDLGDTLNQVTTQIDSMNSRVESLESQTREEPEIGDLTGEIIDVLPTVEPGSDIWEQQRRELHEEYQATGDESINQRYTAHKATAQSLSQALDEPEYMIQKALEKLQSDTHLVRTTEHQNETRYYKIE